MGVSASTLAASSRAVLPILKKRLAKKLAPVPPGAPAAPRTNGSKGMISRQTGALRK